MAAQEGLHDVTARPPKRYNTSAGGVAERLKAPVLKTGLPKGNVGSNPTPSARYIKTMIFICYALCQEA